MDPTSPVPQRGDRDAHRPGEPGEWQEGGTRPRRASPRVVGWLTVSLLLVWGGVTFGVAWFARDLRFDFFGWPFSFWVGAQGGLLVYCLIVWIYARVMNRHEAAVATAPEVAPSEF